MYRTISPSPVCDLADESTPLLAENLTAFGTTPEPPKREEEEEEDEIDIKTLAWIMTSVWIGTFCAGLDGTIMATLAAPIATSFNSLSTLAWLAAAFLIGQATTQPLSGKLTDIYSRRSGLIVSNILFGLGNLLCGFAREEWMMILGRVIAGIGGGCLNTLSAIVAADLIPLRRLGLWQGIGNLFWGLGNGLGGVMGGYFNDQFHWKWAFFAQVPLTVFSLLMMLSYFDQPKLKASLVASGSASRFARIDFLGSFLLIATLVTLLLGVTAGGNIVPWNHVLVLLSLPLTIVLLGGFFYTEQAIAVEPILSPRYLKNRNVLCGCTTLWLHLLVAYTMFFYIPIYFRLRGVSTATAGAVLVPFSVTFSIGSFAAGAITFRTGRYKIILWILLTLILLSSVSQFLVGSSSPLWVPSVNIGIFGVAFGAGLTVIWLAMTSDVQPEDQAVVTSLSYVFRSTGSVIGLALTSAIYQNVLEKGLRTSLAGFENAEEIIYTVRHNLDAILALPSNTQEIVRGCYFIALQASFLGAAVAAAGAFVSGALIKEMKLSDTTDRVHENEGGDGESTTSKIGS